MFGKSRHVRSTKLDTWIGRRTELTGELRFNGALHIDGVIRGDVTSVGGSGKDVLSISEHGRVEGEVRVANVVVNGTVTGDIHASEYLELAAKSRVNGDVHYNTIEMARGAQVNGSLLQKSGAAVEAASARPNVDAGGTVSSGAADAAAAG